MSRTCSFRKYDGTGCGAAPLKGGSFCLWHDPEHTDEVQESRRLGGIRRKREKTVVGAYELQSLQSIEGIRRLLEIALIDTLSLENSVARSRTIAYLAQVSLKTLEQGEFEERLLAIESALAPRLRRVR